jgi:hypothetical protein
MRVITASLQLLVTVVNVRGYHATSEIDNVQLPGVFDFPGRGRRTHSHLPLFSKNESGKGKGNGMYYEYYGKGSKAYKSSKKDKKSEKKDKKEKYEKYYYWEQPTSSRKPTVNPASSPMPTPTDKTGSGSEDFHPTNGSSSEDCPRKYNSFSEMTEAPEFWLSLYFSDEIIPFSRTSSECDSSYSQQY